ncbi:hypothetical protein [Anaerotignum sp.]|uniref:hypothetical protein n=1 Tax=Anaerotignum sp. TaxID=2039241 RepID=UPI002714DF71|nr:hypothetical protein [Anaerotignum sp.]
MESKTRNHYRIAVKDIHASPENGIYITKNEAAKFCIFGSILFLFLTIFAAFLGKK